jgi:hypothetical protein
MCDEWPKIDPQVTGRRPGPRRFTLVRRVDVTGISGTGVVAEGVQFSDGTTVLRWLTAGTARPDVVRPTTVVHEDVGSVLALHGHGGSSTIEWLDEDRDEG